MGDMEEDESSGEEEEEEEEGDDTLSGLSELEEEEEEGEESVDLEDLKALYAEAKRRNLDICGDLKKELISKGVLPSEEAKEETTTTAKPAVVEKPVKAVEKKGGKRQKVGGK